MSVCRRAVCRFLRRQNASDKSCTTGQGDQERLEADSCGMGENDDSEWIFNSPPSVVLDRG